MSDSKRKRKQKAEGLTKGINQPRSCQTMHSSTQEKCLNGRFILCERTEDTKIFIKKFYIPCNSWKCPICSAHKTKVLYAKMKTIPQNKKFYFLTLTLKTNNQGLKYNWTKLNKYWNTFLSHLKRHYSKVQYFRVTELTKAGQPHIHAFINVFIDEPYIQALWLKITGDSHIARFEHIRSDVASYMLKYFLKCKNDIDKIRHATGTKTKLFNSSRGLFPTIKKEVKWKILIFAKRESSIDEFIDFMKAGIPPPPKRTTPLIIHEVNNHIETLEYSILETPNLEFFSTGQVKPVLQDLIDDCRNQLNFGFNDIQFYW